jgi:hypothetical protein
VLTFRRTAVADYTLDGEQILPGSFSAYRSPWA